MMIKNLLLKTLLLFSVLPAFSQYMEGYATSNYSGVNGINYNPASVVDSRTKLDINFFTASMTLDNNFLGVNQNIFNPFATDLWESVVLNDENTNKDVFINADIVGPSFLLTLNERQSIGFMTQHRILSNIRNVSNDFSNLYYSRLNNNSFVGAPITNEETNFSTAGWNEYGIFYGQELYKQNHHWISGGAKLKLTQGTHAGAIDFGRLTTTMNPDSTIDVTGQDVSYFTSANLSNGWEGNAFNFNGIGFGLDIGLNYEWRAEPDSLEYEMDGKMNPAREMSKHKFRFGLTLSEIGFVNYKAGSAGEINPNNPSFNILDYDLRSLAGFEEAIDENFTNTSPINSFRMALPTSISVQGDYNIHKGFYVNATYFHAVKRDRVLNVNYNNRFTVTPRWDWRWMGAYLPVSYTGTGNTHLGVNLMFGPFLIGTRDIGTYLWKDENYFGNIHFGVKVTSLHFRPEDFDKDGVSDAKDKCPEIPGLWAFKGCPDTDGDSIPDAQDKCPEVAGLEEFRGCPDTDGDKVADMHDECPFIPGVKDLNGCPDKDGDGITDAKDNCPDEIGLAYFDGCPDSDGDSIINKLDACPDLPGKLENLGCPDSDGDGVFDFADSCVNVIGAIDNNGCPELDDDGDGLINKKDNCPNQFGPKANNGCPLADQDFDGVIDELDECPKTAGDSSNAGCPIIDDEEEEILEFAFKNLQFETGESIILEESYPSLDALAEMLINKKTWILLIEGHTDDVGNAQDNLVLSKNRVESTKKYLVEKGVNGENLQLKYFGETQPIADNSTPEGRQKNRRVEMEIQFE